MMYVDKIIVPRTPYSVRSGPFTSHIQYRTYVHRTCSPKNIKSNPVPASTNQIIFSRRSTRLLRFYCTPTFLLLTVGMYYILPGISTIPHFHHFLTKKLHFFAIFSFAPELSFKHPPRLLFPMEIEGDLLLISSMLKLCFLQFLGQIFWWHIFNHLQRMFLKQLPCCILS